MSPLPGSEEFKEGEQGIVPGPAESSTGLGEASGGQMPLPQLTRLPGGAPSHGGS